MVKIRKEIYGRSWTRKPRDSRATRERKGLDRIWAKVDSMVRGNYGIFGNVPKKPRTTKYHRPKYIKDGKHTVKNWYWKGSRKFEKGPKGKMIYKE